MATIKSYTSLEQSFKLAKILPLESADMYYDRYGTPNFIDDIVTHKSIKTDKYQHLIPCWSLAALLGVLPKEIFIVDNAYVLSIYLFGLYYWNVNNGSLCFEAKDKDNLVDACVEIIIKLHEQNLI